MYNISLSGFNGHPHPFVYKPKRMIVSVDLLLAGRVKQPLDKVNLLVHRDCLFLWSMEDVTSHPLYKSFVPELPRFLPNEELGALDADLLFVISQEIENSFEQAVELNHLSRNEVPVSYLVDILFFELVDQILQLYSSYTSLLCEWILRLRFWVYPLTVLLRAVLWLRWVEVILDRLSSLLVFLLLVFFSEDLLVLLSQF